MESHTCNRIDEYKCNFSYFTDVNKNSLTFVSNKSYKYESEITDVT